MSFIFLHKLAIANKTNEIKEIISPYRNDTKTLNSIVNRYNRFGMTALHGAIFYGRLETVRLLLDLGANPNGQTRSHLYHYYFTLPLHLAALSGKLRITKALLSAGANPRLKDWSGIIPSQIAKQSGHAMVADLLSKEEEKTVTTTMNIAGKYQVRHVKISSSMADRKKSDREEKKEKTMNRLLKWDSDNMEFIIQDHYSDDDCCYRRRQSSQIIEGRVKFNSLPGVLRVEKREIGSMYGHVPAGPWDFEENTVKTK